MSIARVELTLAVLMLALGIGWWFYPASNIEPLTVVLSGAFLLIDSLRRRKSVEPPPPAILQDRQENSAASSGFASIKYLPAEGSRSLFFQRFGYAFPGLRTVTWYEGRIAVDRLLVLLAQPLRYNPKQGKGPPFWWWRGGNLHIENFERLGPTEVLMNWDELRVRRIAAVPSDDYRRCWVYVETSPMPATGLYDPLERDELRDWIERIGYVREEYAIFKGHKIRREEYDDGAAIIGGVPVRIHGEARIRTRYLTPYNFIIAPLASQFNEGSVDQPLKLMLNLLLQERIAFEELVQMVERLPLPARFDDAE